MEEQAATLLATLRKPSAPVDAKLTLLTNLKSSIKHQRVPEAAQATAFECVKTAIASQTSSSLVSAGFATLGHLVKRLHLQEQTNVIAVQSAKFVPILLDRLGDARENHRNAASQALSDFWPFNHADMERLIREGALGGNNARAKEMAMSWVVKVRGMHRVIASLSLHVLR
jgi:CLIP-associating protein 1/2